ncbi:cytochrome P450 [Streptomyces collinus]|uniref:Cytochrome P450 reductase n=1 Tax=Streptomyces collinus (strain DSM 40733 / Tue 365) TaxID=1214242 RepID=S5VC98_STRC3|nr:cytochrome P450 [Streptomyces collinus]AGS68162.1 cytochrome P450 reductase [Streptomyces collinus Tu 365]UJA06803.1 cytochrome P450 [Streptomyces collinus]UJA12028.1 cytochrome P450 [Streptomyces collinus]UJA13106.1 cytochrome P450 [Streptomyces collinus]UJA18332.1 cytochrome P450 [Streptomyces collinus]
MTQAPLFRQITDFANRADPYPLYTELRRTPVLHEEEGGPYVVSSYYDIEALLHDPRVSSDAANLAASEDDGLGMGDETGGLPPSFLRLDPPEHDRLRRIANSAFGPPHQPRRIENMRGELDGIVTGLIDGFGDAREVDLVDQFAYPFPVTVICRLLGVPREDEPRFRSWVDPLVATLDPDTRRSADPEFVKTAQESRMQLGMYLAGLVEQRTKEPQDDVLSDLANSRGPDGAMTMMEVLSTAVLLLIAGHETTVNLITNGMLTLLRHPEVLGRLREDPGLSVRIVEELLRYEPPVQIVPQRTCITDIELRGTTIPKGSRIWLMIAAGNRDPERFKEPDRFDPDREDIQHLGFGSGIHSCFGAPLARLETQIALSELARRLENPRLVEDPPPYRPNAVLRGPRHLNVAFDGLR